MHCGGHIGIESVYGLLPVEMEIEDGIEVESGKAVSGTFGRGYPAWRVCRRDGGCWIVEQSRWSEHWRVGVGAGCGCAG